MEYIKGVLSLCNGLAFVEYKKYIARKEIGVVVILIELTHYPAEGWLYVS